MSFLANEFISKLLGCLPVNVRLTRYRKRDADANGSRAFLLRRRKMGCTSEEMDSRTMFIGSHLMERC